MNSNVEKCMANGCKVFGYDIDVEHHYVINEHQADVVREVFSRYIGGEILNAIARDLANRGYKTRSGKPACYSFTYSIIHNEKYTGVYRWKGIRIPGGMPAIIPQEVFDMAQKVVPRKSRAREDYADYILSGKLYCGLCGETMHGETTTKSNGRKYHYYRCRRSGDCKHYIRRETIEERLRAVLTAVMENSEVRARCR